MTDSITLLLLGSTLCGGGALYVSFRLVRNLRWTRWQLRGLASSEEGTTVVEFPFALITLVLLTMLTWQLGFMIVGYLFVDVAAFGAARAASVEYPSGRSASAEAQEAAAVALIPVAGGSGGSGSGGSISRAVGAAPGGGAVQRVLSRSEMGSRWSYARRHTSVSVSGADARGGQPVEASVRHQFSLRIPIAARALGRSAGGGQYVTDIEASATVMSERFEEVKPSKRQPGTRARP